MRGTGRSAGAWSAWSARAELAANAILGVKETVFLRYPDGELEATVALRKDLTRIAGMIEAEISELREPSH